MCSSTQLLAVATLAARRAGEFVLANLHRQGDVNAVHRFDVKHKLDVEAQAVATDIIRQAFPGHTVFGEESETDIPPEDGYVWVIDPIDGTVNFFHGMHWWCCSVAVRYNGQSVAGAVFIPLLNEMFQATHDGPALCNGVPIHVSATAQPELAAFATGMGKWRSGEMAFKVLRTLCDLIQRPRMMGAAAADMCMVAAGRLDGFFEAGIHIWDMAAAGLILERAGGAVEVLKTYPDKRLAVLATNGILQTICRDALQPLL
jgi:myo-inositol-1(or 4)-monophosphatase